METLERDQIIGLLERLGDEDDAAALEAARDLHARVSAAGTTWDSLLAPDGQPEAEPDEPDDEPEEEEEEEVAEETPVDMADQDALAIIARILARKDISAQLREELEDYKKDIAEGEFEDMDRRYLRALDARMGKTK
jgi:hypothetical protein